MKLHIQRQIAARQRNANAFRQSQQTAIEALNPFCV
jgi:hypothetical protein